MSFESGSISCRLLLAPDALPDDIHARFAKQAAPPLKNLGTDEINGWVGGRHCLDLPINEANAWLGGYLRLILMRAERKIPPALFRAEYKMAELMRLQTESKTFLPRPVRMQLRQEIEERLLPTMPPQLKSTTFVYHPKAGLVYADALSEKSLDTFRVFFQKATGVSLIPATLETLAAERRQVDVRDWAPASFSPEVPDEQSSAELPGRDFLTWLWFMSEARGGIVKGGAMGSFGLIIEGPLTFVWEGEGAHEIVLRRGIPMLSAEAKTCLLAGKKLRRARLTVVRGDDQWQTGFDADELILRGLKLPEIDERDPVARFQARMHHLDYFKELLYYLIDRFVDERGDANRWKDTRKEIHKWVTERSARK